tara:strand:+ start:1427 stop:2023 length:597 start_codon:yes stop_codon:yes gene_type:complete
MSSSNQKKVDHKEIQTDNIDIDNDNILKLKHEFNDLSKLMKSLGSVIENLETKINNDKKLKDLIESSRIENEKKSIESKNIKHNLSYLKEIVSLLEEENELIIKKRKLELSLEKELSILDNNKVQIKSNIHKTSENKKIEIQNKQSIPPLPPTNNVVQKKETNKVEQAPQKKSLDIQGDLKSALQNKFKNVKTGDESD